MIGRLLSRAAAAELVPEPRTSETYTGDAIDTVSFTAACPACGQDCKWVATRTARTSDTGSKIDVPTYVIHCSCGRDQS